MDRIRIVLAGCDRIFREQVKAFLRSVGMEAISTVDAEETRTLLREAHPDILYLSSKIAGGGLNFLQNLKNDPDLAPTRVVMICANEGESYAQSSLEAGCEHVLRKPLDRRAFLASVMNFISLEKRSNARFPVRMDVDYGINGVYSFTSHSINIGIGGIFLETEQVFRQGTPLTIRFTLPRGTVVMECNVKVAWINYRDAPVKPSLPSGMGLEFMDLSEEHLELINHFLHDTCISVLLEGMESKGTAAPRTQP